jgi:L-threonylcarbamoyladenylate synthase
MNNNVQQAINTFNSGGVVIFPTDTVYGIGCRLDKPESVERVFSIRNRPQEKAVLAVVDGVEMAQKYLQPIPEEVRHLLIDKYWANGGLTIILSCLPDKVPSLVRGGGFTLAVRQTNHPVLLQILKEVGVPIIAPSANFAGEKTPVTFDDLDPKLVVLADYVLQGECGGNKPSTIIDCSIKPWKIVRQGAVKVF